MSNYNEINLLDLKESFQEKLHDDNLNTSVINNTVMITDNLNNKKSIENSVNIDIRSLSLDDFVLNNDYFNESQQETIQNKNEEIIMLRTENEKLKTKFATLEKKNDELEKKIIDLLKSLNELLKLNKTDEQLLDLNIDDINTKITSIMYRELRLKHLVPFSPLMGNFGFKNPNILKKI